MARIVSVNAKHGHSNSNGAWSMVLRAPRIISPQLGAGGTTPRPRNDSPLSKTIAAAQVRLTCTSTGPSTCGRMVRNMIRLREAPSTRTASTKSCARVDSTPA